MHRHAANIEICHVKWPKNSSELGRKLWVLVLVLIQETGSLNERLQCFIKTDAELRDLDVVTMRRERHKLELQPASNTSASLNVDQQVDTDTSLRRGGFQVSDKGDGSVQIQAAAAFPPPPPLWLSEREGGGRGGEEVVGIKRFRINCSKPPAKCCFPRPPLPGGPSPLKLETPWASPTMWAARQSGDGHPEVSSVPPV